MIEAMILRRDLSGDQANGYVSKILLRTQKNCGLYSLEFSDDVELTTRLRISFLGSRWFNEVDVFIGEALRHNAAFIELAVPEEEVLRFLRCNRERCGRHSLPLAAQSK